MSCKIAICTVSKMILTKAKAGKSIANVTTISENIQQIYRSKPMSKCGFNKIALRYGCSPVNFPKATSGGLRTNYHA